MALSPRKISKEKGVQMCADFLFSGKATREILQFFAENYVCSQSTVEKWIREAKPMADVLRREADDIRKRQTEIEIIESAKKLNITREGIQARLWAIANGNLQDFFTKNNNAIQIKDLPREVAGLLASMEVDELYQGAAGQKYWVGLTKKFRLHDPLKAIDMLNKMNGWYKENDPVKVNITIGYGKEVPV